MMRKNQGQLSHKKSSKSKDAQKKDQFFESSKKHLSGHTKASTNFTVHSVNSSNKLQERTLRKHQGQASNSKQNKKITAISCTTTKRSAKIKLLQFTKDPSEDEVYESLKSYRQYCLIGKSFVPIKNDSQKRIVDELLEETASTSKGFKKIARNNKQSCERSSQVASLFPFQSLRNSYGEVQRHQECRILTVQKKDQSISNIFKANQSYQEQQTEAAPDLTQIGIQYSARSAKVQEQQRQAQSLSDLLLRLQFRHLPNDQVFSNLSVYEKEHYSQLLETLMQKLALKVPPAQNIAVVDKQSPVAAPFFSQRSQAELNTELLEHLVYDRQCLQLNEASEQISVPNNGEINTSLLAVVNYICNFFCYIELHYSDELVAMLRRIYGLTYRQKYRRISKGLPTVQEKKFKVIDVQVFEDFLQQIVHIQQCQSQGEPNVYDIIHSKAIFNAFNELLDEYRPFYSNNGEAFPWALKMLTSMSEYSIDEDSIEIIFQQARQRITQMVGTMCGIIVEHSLVVPQSNPLAFHRNDRENRLILGWLQQSGSQTNQIEVNCTRVMHELANLIYEEIMDDFSKEFLQIKS